MAGLQPEARARIDEITRLIVEKLLLTPTEQLKALNDETTVVAYADALNKLFSLTARDSAPVIPDAPGDEGKDRTDATPAPGSRAGT